MKSARILTLTSLALAARLMASAASQTISFDAIPNQIFGVSPFVIAAEASSGLPVTLTSTTPAVCKTASVLVTLLRAGPCFITANQPGNATYSAATPVTRSFTVSAANPAGTLLGDAGSPVGVGTAPNSVVVADFNGDGNADLAVSNGFDGTVTVKLGNGSGGFATAAGSPFAVGTSPGSMVVADFNGDGKLDLAVANGGSNNVTVLLGNGSGGFALAQGSPVAVGFPGPIVAGDFNGDGIQDLAVINTGPSLIVLTGDGTGKFAASTTSPFGAGAQPSSIAVGDFNGDGVEDLAVANGTGDNVTVLLGNALGGFSAVPGSPFAVGSLAHSLVVGDFNGDGNQDIAAASGFSVTVLLGNGSGGFAAADGSPFSVGPSPLHIAAGDFNGDGIPDLITTNPGDNSVTVLLGNGAGAFAAVANGPIPVGANPFGVVVGDFNGDGIPDIATANFGSNNVTVLLGGIALTSSGLFTTSPLTITFGQSVPLTYNVFNNTVVFNPPTGVAIFSDGANVLGTAAQSTSPYTFTAASLGAGSHTLSARYSGDTRNSGSSSNSIAIQVNQAPQTITFNALNSVALGSGPVALTATASSGLAVSYASTAQAVCTVAGNIVTLVAVGACSITASQTGNANYLAAPSVTQSFTISAAVSVAVPQPTGGIANAASASQATASVVSPGSYVAIYGTALAGTGYPSATSLPLPTTLNGTQVSLCGLSAPLLYASATQINALMPEGLTPNAPCPLIVINGTVQSAPVQLTVTELQPGIYTVNETGSGPGIVTEAFTGQLNTASNPAHAADNLVIYCTGLGLVQGPNGQAGPADGAATPSTTLFHTTSTVTATIGGVGAPVSFSGLTPTLAGLYQVNVQVPLGVTPGNAVSLVITATDLNTGASAQSNSATISVQ